MPPIAAACVIRGFGPTPNGRGSSRGSSRPSARRLDLRLRRLNQEFGGTPNYLNALRNSCSTSLSYQQPRVRITRR
jgi:hypothetical protein